MTIQALDCMELTTNFLINQCVTPAATLLGTLGVDSVPHFKRAIQHMNDTKASTDGV